LFFNLLAIALGFGVLISSKVVPLNNFGTIVAISVTTSFFISMTLLPALTLLFKPRFITRQTIDNLEINNAGISLLNPTTKTVIAVSVVGLLGWVLASDKALADDSELPQGRWVMEQVNNVDDGDAVSRKLTMTMIDKRGKERVRETVGYRKYFGDEKRTVLFYLTPRNVKDTGFLTYDYPSVEVDDDQWLYLPALRKSRRISASDRGDYFLGTDFSYDDIKKEGKIEINDYHFTTLRQEVINGKQALVVEGIPVDKETAKELGYGRVVSWIDTANWVVVRAKYWDIKLNELKTLDISDIRQVEGIWTRHQLYVQNHKTGHITQFVFSDVDYSSPVNDTLFTRQALSRGAR
jgi:outer membrane lipoprotein-sorting protein